MFHWWPLDMAKNDHPRGKCPVWLIIHSAQLSYIALKKIPYIRILEGEKLTKMLTFILLE